MRVVEYKVGHNLLKITDSDRVMFNKAVYIIHTQRVGLGFDKTKPVLAKAKAKKLISLGVLIPTEKYISVFGGIKTEYDNYKFDLEKLEKFIQEGV